MRILTGVVPSLITMRSVRVASVDMPGWWIFDAVGEIRRRGRSGLVVIRAVGVFGHTGSALALAAGGRGPVVGVRVVAHTDSYAECALLAARTPCPASALADGEVVPAESEPSAEDADDGAGDQVGSEVVEFDEARGADVDGDGDGDECDDDQVVGRCGCLVAGGDGAREVCCCHV